MRQEHSGLKFATVLEEHNFPANKHISELNWWCNRFAEYGLAPKVNGDHAGNLSFRTPIGFIITAAGADLGNLNESDFIEVMDADSITKRVIARGSKEPSSESVLHHAVYKSRPDINAVFHGHDEMILKYYLQLDLPATQQEQPSGSTELMKEVRRVIATWNYIVIINHGFLSFGKTIEKTGRLVIKQHDRAVKWQQSLAH